MTARRLVLSAVIVVSGVVGFVAWLGRPSSDLGPVARLAALGSFDAADAALDAILRAYPDHDDAHLLAAQLQLDRPEPPTRAGERPAPAPALVALDHLARVHPANPTRDALVGLYRGKAEYRLAQLDKAEVAWLDALQSNPAVPEAGWCLLEMYYLEGRGREAQALALRLHQAEPDPRDRVQLLLELLRQDAQPMAPESVAQWFEPAARQAPADLHVSLTLGLALARTGHSDQGLKLLGQLAHSHPDQADAWDAWLVGLDDAGEVEGLEAAVQELPPALANSPRFARHAARLAQERGDFPAAIAAYRRALEATPLDRTLSYRLARCLRLTGALAEAERIEQDRQTFLDANRGLRPLYDEANAIPTLGVVARPDLYRRIADLRERMGLVAEADAWNRLILKNQPGDPASVAALARLGQ